LPSPIIKENPFASPEKHTTSRVNVDASKLDQLMYLVSELVTTKSELILALERQNFAKISDAAEKIEKLSNLFSENALSIRLVSLNEMLSRFKRLVRDLSKQLNKSVDFLTVGDDTELDKNIIDKIGEPVMHLIRNCIDHGIESPEKRKSSGKSETGTIKIEAIKSGNYVFLTISDDGNGIDLNYIKTKAIENGFINANSNLTEKETLDLIFLPGFSTAQSLTNISGRGVGMDIVKKKIQEIRGEISITTNKGKGTTFALKLQQTVSIIETLLIEADGQTYALPIEDIEACILEPTESFTDRINHHIGYNGQLIPYISLRETLCNVSRNATTTEKIVIIKRVEKVYAIVVDNIIGEYQAVIKPLGEAFSKLKFLSGASLLGDGSIALLLDTDKLWFEISAKSYN
jgi:two-component system chemotaxis sensor kinase CheA